MDGGGESAGWKLRPDAPAGEDGAVDEILGEPGDGIKRLADVAIDAAAAALAFEESA